MIEPMYGGGGNEGRWIAQGSGWHRERQWVRRGGNEIELVANMGRWMVQGMVDGPRGGSRLGEGSVRGGVM